MGAPDFSGSFYQKRDCIVKTHTLTALKISSASAALGLALISSSAFAQTAPAAQPAEEPADRAIVVTGSIIRNPAAATASPVVSVTADDITKRGISSVADAVQSLTSNNQGTAPPSWSAFGFATGASAPSLRGLNDAYTLTLFNGLRTAPYPLADDGYRNFVDINTIPGSIVESIEVLQDGASATYGTDAIAGVVNVIIKRQIKGLHLAASAGVSERGDAGDQKVSATFGYGDLNEQGFNVYVNAEYQNTAGLKLGDRDAPFNTSNQSTICGTAAQGCLHNNVRNGIQADGSFAGFQTTIAPFVRPYSAAFGSLGGYQALNSAGCGDLRGVALTTAQRAGTITPAVVCQQDLNNQYRYYNSPTERKGANFRATFKISDSAEAYLMFNYYNTRTDNLSTPSGYTGATANGGTIATVSTIFLPVYVCPQGVATIGQNGAFSNSVTASGCTAANGTLNPNNPFAAQGNQARLFALPYQPRQTIANTQTYRATVGLNGSFSEGFDYSVQGTYSTVTLDRTQRGFTYLKGLLKAIATGGYNFVTPTANTTAQQQSVFPDNFNHSSSKLAEVTATVSKEMFDLPGGKLIVAVSGQYRHEEIHNPSSNAPNNIDPTARYYAINAVGVDGSRNVWSVGYEISAPILDTFRVKALGSYDHYSSGQSRFSPKFEAEFRPIEQVKLRGTYSRGFRIPGFSESFALPTTGFVSGNINCASPTFTAFCAAHASNPSYYTGGYNYGLTSAGNPNLKPETSEGFTAGIVLQPTRQITLTADFYQVRLNNVIIPTSASNAIISAYYLNNGVVNGFPGISSTQGVADPLNPGALPLLGTIIGSYKNADKYLARGLDFSADVRLPLTNTISLRSKASASMLLRLEQTNEDGTVLRYDNSLGACNITSCSGAPKWRATWQNTLDFNDVFSFTLTANYTSGFSEVATDSGGTYGNCAQSTLDGQIVAYDNGDPVICNEKSTFYMDGHVEAKVGSKFTIYMDVKNIFNRKPDYTPNAAYGIYNFNPAWQDSLFIGRAFRVGAKVDF